MRRTAITEVRAVKSRQPLREKRAFSKIAYWPFNTLFCVFSPALSLYLHLSTCAQDHSPLRLYVPAKLRFLCSAFLPATPHFLLFWKTHLAIIPGLSYLTNCSLQSEKNTCSAFWTMLPISSCSQSQLLLPVLSINPFKLHPLPSLSSASESPVNSLGS